MKKLNVVKNMGPMGPRGLGPITKKRKEGPGGRTGRKDRADGRTGRTDGRTGRTEGPDGRKDPFTPHPHPPKNMKISCF